MHSSEIKAAFLLFSKLTDLGTPFSGSCCSMTDKFGRGFRCAPVTEERSDMMARSLLSGVSSVYGSQAFRPTIAGSCLAILTCKMEYKAGNLGLRMV